MIILSDIDEDSASAPITSPTHVDEKAKIEVDILRKEHLDKAYFTIRAAFENDPLKKYLSPGGSDPNSHKEGISKRLWKTYTARSMKRKYAYTVDSGSSILFATPATSDAPRPPLSDRMVELFIGLAVLGFGLLNSREKKKREKEVQDKTTKMIEDSLGDSAKEMVYVSLIATSPESQGRGYGGALMKTIILTASTRGRALYLLVANNSNIAYYESFGFKSAGNATVGNDNPTWRESPLTVTLMTHGLP